MRLNRFLSASGYSSRRKGEEVIRSGRVTVNGVVVTDPAVRVDPGSDIVAVDGVGLTVGGERRYYAMNKPTGVIVSRGDTHGRATVYDFLGPETNGVFSVGRLDADTSGLLLFTDDGDMAHRLTHPSFGVEKVYRAEVEGRVGEREARLVREGLVLEDGPAAPAEMRVLESDDRCSIVEITLHEGRKRQVRRMFERLGHPVRQLERIAFGGITTGGIPLGGYRALTAGEVEKLRKRLEPGPKRLREEQE